MGWLMLRAELLISPTPETIHTIIEHCCQHRAWFSDYLWDAPNRREITSAHIARMYYDMTQERAALWGVWRDSEIVGILHIGDIVPRTDAKCHFVFFDHKLADKRDLCVATMRWCFDKLDLHRLSVEIPTYARALAKFARKLGFRYEAEGREPYTHKDERLEPLGLAKAYVGSRRFASTLYEGNWHDQLCLSILREEFDELYGRSTRDQRSLEGEAVLDPEAPAPRPEPVRAGPDAPATEQRLPERLPQESAEHHESVAADLVAATANRRPLG